MLTGIPVSGWRRSLPAMGNNALGGTPEHPPGSSPRTTRQCSRGETMAFHPLLIARQFDRRTSEPISRWEVVES